MKKDAQELFRLARTAQPAMVAERAAACLIDNRDGLPYVSVEWAVEEVIQRARRNGIGFAGIRNSAHVGVLGIHLLPVAQAGLVGLAFTNSPAAIPPWGGKKALFGTNPVAGVFPRRDQHPIVVDLALTTVVRGRIMMAMRRRERIPEGWALDRRGKPTPIRRRRSSTAACSRSAARRVRCSR